MCIFKVNLDKHITDLHKGIFTHPFSHHFKVAFIPIFFLNISDEKLLTLNIYSIYTDAALAAKYF